jgi:hypothetical protein
MKEHSKRRRSMEEFYTNYLKEMEKRLEIKSEKAVMISKQNKEERITRIAK